MNQFEGTRAEANALAAVADKLLGLPRKGRHIGGGRHVALGNAPGPGWTTSHKPEQHPTIKARYAVPIHNELDAAIDAPKASGTLSPAELALVRAGKLASVPRDASWRRKGGQP